MCFISVVLASCENYLTMNISHLRYDYAPFGFLLLQPFITCLSPSMQLLINLKLLKRMLILLDKRKSQGNSSEYVLFSYYVLSDLVLKLQKRSL